MPTLARPTLQALRISGVCSWELAALQTSQRQRQGITSSSMWTAICFDSCGVGPDSVTALWVGHSWTLIHPQTEQARIDSFIPFLYHLAFMSFFWNLSDLSAVGCWLLQCIMVCVFVLRQNPSGLEESFGAVLARQLFAGTIGHSVKTCSILKQRGDAEMRHHSGHFKLLTRRFRGSQNMPK